MKRRFDDIAMFGVAVMILAMISPLAIYQTIRWSGGSYDQE